MKTALHLILGGLLLPGVVLLLVPGILVWLYPIELPNPTLVRYWFAKVMLPGGLVLMGTCAAQFVVTGHGTPAPWAPPKKLVTSGLYAYVRNPMILGMLLMLGGEALLIASHAIGIWFAMVATVIVAYVHLIEERGLQARFGDAYATYKANVPAWFPRFKAWAAPDQPDPSDP
ncbi:isoprenylcysteine carboxylmethyltransferase family protein [Magnetovibrio sp.]|uniref:methyltransferase family protein n=1 Tax=Magnetovibrio sp. TaxID=2024836 RepID=UPI002F92A7D3